MDSAQLVANDATPTQASTTTSDEMQGWKKISIDQAYYSTKEEYVCRQTMTLGAKFSMNVMIV